MDIRIYINNDSMLEVVSFFGATEENISKFSARFKVDRLTEEKATKELIVPFKTRQDNNFENYYLGRKMRGLKRDEKDDAASIAYIMTNSIEEARRLLTDASVNHLVNHFYIVLQEGALAPMSFQLFLCSDLEKYLDFIEKITDGTGKFSPTTREQLNKVIQYQQFQVSDRLLKLLEKKVLTVWGNYLYHSTKNIWLSFQADFTNRLKVFSDLFKESNFSPFLLFLPYTIIIAFFFYLVMLITYAAITLLKNPSVSSSPFSYRPVLGILLFRMIYRFLLSPPTDWILAKQFNTFFADEQTNKTAIISYLLDRSGKTASLFAQHIDAFNFADGVMDRINSYGFASSYRSNFFNSLEMARYLRKRMAILDSAAWWGLSDEQKSEREFVRLFDQYVNQGGRKYSRWIPEDLYEIGMYLLDQGKPEYAVLFLSQVRPDQKNYKHAIEKCIHYFRSVNNMEKATYYAERIGATEFAPSSYCLNRSIDTANQKVNGKNNTSFQASQESLLRQHSIFPSDEKNQLIAGSTIGLGC